MWFTVAACPAFNRTQQETSDENLETVDFDRNLKKRLVIWFHLP
jgi:hypothetical protein